jgi:hypothetical protein
MKKITLWLEVIAAIIAVAILQACTTTTGTTTTTGKCQCEQPTLNPTSAHATVDTPVTVRLKTNTPGAKVRYKVTGIPLITGSTTAESGTVTFKIQVFGRTLTATAYKPGCADSAPAVGHYSP